MQIIVLKIISAVMSVIIMLSNAFPALFAGREYVDLNGGSVSVVEKNVVIGSLIIKDYQSYKELGDIGVDYTEEYFENNALAISTIEYQTGDEIYIRSIYKEGTVYTVEYYYFEKNITTVYSPEYMTFIIETTKDTTLVYHDNLLSKNAFRPCAFTETS